jgi:serine/threonine-protein phosphatase 2B regulatory subunit
MNLSSLFSLLCTRSTVYTKNKHIEEWREQFEALKLNASDIGKLFNIFRRVDVDNSGTIELVELLVHIDVERTKFSERIFSIFDEDASGEIDFREFVLSLWNYCSLSNATLDIFAFDLYDRDSSGQLSGAEVDGMLRDVYGNNFSKNQFARA